MKNAIRKIIILTRIGLVKRYFKYKKYNKFFKINGGFIADVHDLEIRDGKVVTTGKNPFISIKLYKSTKRIGIDYNITTANHDGLYLYYIPIEERGQGFNVMWRKKYGNADGNSTHKNMYFYDSIRNIRIDLGESTDISIEQLEFKSYSFDKDSNYDAILSSIPKSNNDKKIVIVTHAMNETGAPILAYNIAKSFKEKKYDVAVVSLGNGFLEEKFDELMVPVINLNQDGINDKIVDKSELENAVKALSERGYNKVITNTIISGLTVPMFNKYNFRIISLIHEMKLSIVKYKMENGGRYINMYSDYIVFPDKTVQDEFFTVFDKNENKAVINTQGLYKEKEEIVLDRSELERKYNVPKDSKIVVGSGTGDLRKGIDLFLNAAQQLISIEGKNEYHFIWAGKIIDPNVENWFECQFDRFGIKDRIHIIDFIKDKKEYQNLISCSDAFWLTSREDPYPSVMIESLEYGTPVLAFSKCGGANTLLADNRGTLIDNFDTKKLAEETVSLVNDEARVKTQLSNAQDFIKKNLVFSNYISELEKLLIEKTADKYADLSVVVPNYNYEEYLPIRLNSIINQTIKPKEIILLDDVSKDNSVEVSKAILEKAKKEHNIDYKIVVNEQNNGCFRQWLKGIDLAKHEFVWIAEADDYAQPDFVESLMPAFKDKDVSISYCQSKVINEHCNVLDYRYTSYTDDLDLDKWNHDFVDDGKTQVANYFSKKNIIPNVSSTIIRKSATKGMSDELSKYSVIGDWLAYIYILNNGKVAYTSRTLNGHRRHSNSIIARKEKTPEFIKEILMIKNFILNNIKMNNKQINDMLLSIEDYDYYSTIISKNEELKKVYDEFVVNIKSKQTNDNILIIIPDLSVGGGQSVAIRLANSFADRYNVFLVNAREYLKTSIMEEMISDEVTLLPTNTPSALKGYNDLLRFKSVISFIWWSDKLAYQAFGDTDTRLIISMHGCYEMLLHNPDVDEFFNREYRNIINRADNIVYTADKNKEVLIETGVINSSKVSKIDNGFVLGEYPKKDRSQLGIKEDDFVFGLVARAIPEKGYEEAIKAINIVNKKASKKAHLILVGASEYIDELKTKYKEDYIHFIDKFSLPNEWIGWEEIFDVGLLPSYFKSESLPTVIVENLFLGNPIIATDIAEIKSMIVSDDKQAGIAINLKDGKADIDELVDAMNKMMTDKKLYEEYKKNTNIFAKRFDMNECLDKYEKLIEDDENE